MPSKLPKSKPKAADPDPAPPKPPKKQPFLLNVLVFVAAFAIAIYMGFSNTAGNILEESSASTAVAVQAPEPGIIDLAASDIKNSNQQEVNVVSVELSDSETASIDQEQQQSEEQIAEDRKVKKDYVPSPISPTLNVPENAEIATFAAGCFWGVEHIFRRYFSTTVGTSIQSDSKGGLIDAKVGYSGGSTTSEYPSYKEVCTNTTGHAEVLQISYDPGLVSYETLVDFFFRIHDPTTVDQQGPDDFGEQYRSAVFFHNDKQRQVATSVLQKYQKEWYDPANQTIVTQIKPILFFWDAEQYHQLYLNHNPDGYMCPSHYLRTSPPAPVKN